MKINEEIREILDIIDFNLKAGKNEVVFNKSELDANPPKKFAVEELVNIDVISLSNWIFAGDNILNKGTIQIPAYINKQKFLDFCKSLSIDKDEGIVETNSSIINFNGKTISYRNKTYGPEEPILCLINKVWDKKYRAGIDPQRGFDLSPTILEDCRINNLEKSIDSFNRATRKKKIPLRIKGNRKKFYLEEIKTD